MKGQNIIHGKTKKNCKLLIPNTFPISRTSEEVFRVKNYGTSVQKKGNILKIP